MINYKIQIIIALFVIMLTGCNEPTANVQPKQQVVNQEPQNNWHMKRVYFEEHSYVKYERGVSSSIVHDPDCSCRKKGGKDAAD